MNPHRGFLILLAPVLVLGAYLRWVDLGGPSLWLDEILHLQIAAGWAAEPWVQRLNGAEADAENGALYYFLQSLGQSWMPGEVGARLFPAVIGILTLPLMALAGWLLAGPLVAFTATFLLAFSPLHVYYSREGRPYSLLMALALVMLCVLLQKGSRVSVVVAWVSCLLAAFVGIHSVPILLSFLALSGLAWISSLRYPTVRRQGPYLSYLVAATLALGLVYGFYMTRTNFNTPILEESQKQVDLEKSAQFQTPLSERSGRTFLASLTTSGHPSVPMVDRSWGLIALSGLGLLVFVFRRPRALAMTAGLFLLPAALSILALVSVGRSYTTRYTSPALPAFLLLSALGIVALAELVGKLPGLKGRATWQVGARWSSTVLLLLESVAPNWDAARADPYRKLDWREVARFYDTVAIDGEPIVVATDWPRISLDYYLRRLGRDVEFLRIWESPTLGDKMVAEQSHGWLLTAGFRKNEDARSWMHRFVPVMKRRQKDMGLFFFPDFPTFVATRFEAGKGAWFEEQFARMNQRFEFSAEELALQGQGWSFAEGNSSIADYQWALGEQAELALPVCSSRGASLKFRALPFSYPGAPPQRVQLTLNEIDLGTVELPEGWSEHQVAIPESAWRDGANVLYLSFARSTRPAEVAQGSTDGRSLSVAFDYLEVAR